MTGDRQETLAALLSDYRARNVEASPWEEVVDQTGRLRLGAAYTDVVVAGGLITDEVYMASIDSWPSDVRESLERLGLFDKYSPTTLRGVFSHLSDPQIRGLVNDVKGTDQEILVARDISAGEYDDALPGVRRAELADSTTQPGWDIAVTTDSGHVEFLQSKATSNWRELAEHGSAARSVDISYEGRGSSGRMSLCRRGSLRSSSVTWWRSLAAVI